MTADNWRELLDDPEVRDVITRAVNGPGRRRYDPRGKDALVFDELEPYLYDRAVDIAQIFPGEAAPIGDPERRSWYGYLWAGLNTAIPWLWKEYAGAADSAKREVWRAGLRSVEAITETNENGDAPPVEAMVSHSDPFWWHRVTASDPLGVILRRERLEAMLRQAENRARGGAYVTETHPDVLCREPMCRDLTHSAGWCKRHYRQHFERWGRADGSSPLCAKDSCPLVAVTRGFCARHYEAELKRRKESGDLWVDAPKGPCTVDGCDRIEDSKGMCDYHYQIAREASHPPCTVEDCDRNAFAKGLCRLHYRRAWEQRKADESNTCTVDACRRVIRAKGLCEKHYREQRRST